MSDKIKVGDARYKQLAHTFAELERRQLERPLTDAERREYATVNAAMAAAEMAAQLSWVACADADDLAAIRMAGALGPVEL